MHIASKITNVMVWNSLHQFATLYNSQMFSFVTFSILVLNFPGAYLQV